MTLRYTYVELFRRGELQRRRLYKILEDLDTGGPGPGTETDPVFMAHVAHNLTSADLSKLHDSTNPLVDTNTLNVKLQDIVDAINALP